MAELILLWNRKPGPDRKRSHRQSQNTGGIHRLGADGPAAVVVATHENFPASAADGAVGLVAIVIVLVSTLQEWVLSEVEECSGKLQLKRLPSFFPKTTINGRGGHRPYLAAVAHGSYEEGVLQRDVEASAGDADICANTTCRANVYIELALS